MISNKKITLAMEVKWIMCPATWPASGEDAFVFKPWDHLKNAAHSVSQETGQSTYPPKLSYTPNSPLAPSAYVFTNIEIFD